MRCLLEGGAAANPAFFRVNKVFIAFEGFITFVASIRSPIDEFSDIRQANLSLLESVTKQSMNWYSVEPFASVPHIFHIFKLLLGAAFIRLPFRQHIFF